MVFMIGERKKAALNAVNDALEKISQGLYGICEECGREIHYKRLRVIPFAKYCVHCQSEIEKRSRLALEENPEEARLYDDLAMIDVKSGDE